MQIKFNRLKTFLVFFALLISIGSGFHNRSALESSKECGANVGNVLSASLVSYTTPRTQGPYAMQMEGTLILDFQVTTSSGVLLTVPGEGSAKAPRWEILEDLVESAVRDGLENLNTQIMYSDMAITTCSQEGDEFIRPLVFGEIQEATLNTKGRPQNVAQIIKDAVKEHALEFGFQVVEE